MSGGSLSETALTINPSSTGILSEANSLVDRTRYNFLQLQALVTVVLSYQLLFSPAPILTGDTQILAALLGLMLLCGCLIVLPAWMVGASWFPGALALGDTAITTALIYLSGNASSDLYLAYFVIILLATLTRTPTQMSIFIGLVGLLYGFVLYLESAQSGMLLTHHLMRIPLLMIMAIFYSRTVESVRTLTYYDPLTSLPNRRQFMRHLTQRLAQATRPDQQIAMLYLDLDGFNLVNETLGHDAGDQLLRATTDRLALCLRKSDTLARLGGDEFAVLLENLSSVNHVSTLAQRILDSVAPAFSLNGREIFMTVSIGIALYPQDAKDGDSLVKHADAALNRAKEKGRSLYQFFSADMDAQAHLRLALRSRLSKALERQELLVHYQPLIDLATRRIIGLEALVRWQQSDAGLVLPAQFIPFAEECGLIVPIGEWVLKTASRQMRDWHAEGFRSVELTVNLSARQFRQPDLVRMVSRVLESTGLDPRCLELEITESAMIVDAAMTQHTLRELKALGLRLAIDDFGTGYASLSHLTRLPIDTLKIDRAFIRSIPTGRDAGAIVTAIIALARALNLHLVAEGVENEAQVEFLRAHGCHAVQGFLFSRAVPSEEVPRLLKQWPASPPQPTGPTPNVITRSA
jgi:diguanylate cyclase (GGDEF)-like protein